MIARAERRRCRAALLALLTVAWRPAAAQEQHVPQLLGAQVTVIGQDLLALTSPYQAKNSLQPQGGQEITHTYGVYGGWRAARGVEFYLDVEMARNGGDNLATGLAGITNGDVIRQGTAQLSNGPFVARLFTRLSLGLGPDSVHMDRAQDQVAGWIPTRRLEFVAGKVAASDVFDVNRYANAARSQFMNWGLFQNSAWDYPADTRGFTYGASAAWITPTWSLRLGTFLMPTMANGNVFDSDWPRARGDAIELTVVPNGETTIRLLAYDNRARMGSYRDALAMAGPQPPDIVADDQPGRTKVGVGLNIEQPMGDSGETGAFLRLGWNDGRNESFAFTEVETHISAGVQLAGSYWSRPGDRFALALLSHGLLAPHREYLAAGGSGFLLGDGALSYGREWIIEAYYRVQLGPWIQVSPDVQYAVHPGYNTDRGPATMLSLRFNARY